MRFHEPDLWERYRWQLTAVLSASLLLAVLILVLLWERTRRRRAHRLNLAVLDSLPGSVAILDRSGTVLRANPPPRPSEGLGRLLAERFRAPGASYLESLREAARTGPRRWGTRSIHLSAQLEENRHEASRLLSDESLLKALR